MSIPRAHTSRRTAIALALSAPLALAACDLDPPSSQPTKSATADPLPDEAVVGAARKSILLTVATIEAVNARHRSLRVENAPLLALHATHLAVLGEADTDETVEGEIPQNTPALARKQVASTENGLAGTLVGTAGEAASGDLARVLASMAAAVTQRVVV